MKPYIFAAILIVAATATATFQAKTKGPAGSAPKPPQGQWVRAPIGPSEMTAEFPGKPEKVPVALPGEIRAKYDILETVSYTPPNQTFAVFASYAVSKAQAPISLDGAARGALDRVKGQAASTDYKESITNVTVVGLPGRKIQCSFTNGGDKLFLVGVIFTDRTRMWQVIWTGEVSPLNTSLASHVIASVKRSASRAGTG